MHDLDLRINACARSRDQLITRGEVRDLGGTDQFIERRLQRGQWSHLQRGVYLVGIGPPTWTQLLRAGVLAAGDGAQVSHRAALLHWGLDGLASSPPEIVVPFNGEPTPQGVIVHRSRRAEAPVLVRGLPTTSIERTLLESAALVPAVVTEKAFSSAWRRGLTSPTKCERYLERHGGRGRRGTTQFRDVVALYNGTARSAGSSGEVAFLRTLRAAGVEEPVRQFVIELPDGSKAVVDFAWPRRRKLVEFVGLAVHADARAHASDTLREDDILTATGWELRRFAPETLRRDPEDVARRVLRFLCGSPSRIH